MSAGDVASKMLVDGIKTRISGSFGFFLKFILRVSFNKQYSFNLKKMVKRENHRIYYTSKASQRPMASTIVLLRFYGLEVEVLHVGDSRAYLLRNNELTQITSDHSLVNELYEQGHITRQEMRTHPQKNIITRAVGTNKSVTPDITIHNVQPGDGFLLCSDGLTGMLTDKEIKSILTTKHNSLADAVRLMIEQANTAGGVDNITAVLVKVEKPG
jgi:protein phosphatase